MFKTPETMALNNSSLLKYSIDDTNLGFSSFPNARYICRTNSVARPNGHNCSRTVSTANNNYYHMRQNNLNHYCDLRWLYVLGSTFSASKILRNKHEARTVDTCSVKYKYLFCEWEKKPFMFAMFAVSFQSSSSDIRTILYGTKWFFQLRYL